MNDSSDPILTESEKSALTDAEQDAILQAYQDVLVEFAACFGETPDADAIKVIKKHFKATIKKGMLTSGSEIWAEPHKSFGLKYVCKIARRHKQCCDSDLDDYAKGTIDKAREACGQVVPASKIGLLCP